jgi:hypothetical protein
MSNDEFEKKNQFLMKQKKNQHKLDLDYSPRLPCRKTNKRKNRLENKCNKMIRDEIEKN